MLANAVGRTFLDMLRDAARPLGTPPKIGNLAGKPDDVALVDGVGHWPAPLPNDFFDATNREKKAEVLGGKTSAGKIGLGGNPKAVLSQRAPENLIRCFVYL